jgi:farnesyl diphosphate synthase
MSELILQNYITRHERLLQQLIENAVIPATLVKKAILYTLFPGGKRLRPLLVYLCGDLVEAPIEALDYIAVAVELIHCYSLVHDDLPAMDNDDQRRGKPSCHRAFDEATAILVGDGMQALAVEILLNKLPAYLTAEQVITITHELVHASGFSGMVSGQSMDLTELNLGLVEENKLKQIHYLKTGKLISAAINMALGAADLTNPAGPFLHKFADHLGLVFQMQDDYLDYYLPESLGKGRASDVENQKTTFATLYDKKALSANIAHLYQLAETSLTIFAQKADPLKTLLIGLQERS